MIDILLTILIGIILGTTTGLLPGLHINLLAVIILTITTQYFANNQMLPAVLIFSTGITQNFVEGIQTTILNAPTPETALMPAQAMLKDGKAHAAMQLFITGAFEGLLSSIAAFPLLLRIIPLIYDKVKNYTVMLLILLIVMMILREKTITKKIWAILIIVLASAFGKIVLDSSVQQPLFLMLSSLFGTSTLICALLQKSEAPEQEIKEYNCKTKTATTGTIAGLLTLVMTTILPGAGATQASFLPSAIMNIKGNKYIILLGSIGTADFIVSLATFATIHKARNGAIATMTQLVNISSENLTTFLAIALITGGFAMITSLAVAKKAVNIFNKINQKILSIIVLTFLSAMTIWFAGINGILAMITGTLIGQLTLSKNISRSNLMACLIIPIISNNMSKIT